MKFKSIALLALIGWQDSLLADAMDQLAQALSKIQSLQPTDQTVKKDEIKNSEFIDQSLVLSRHQADQQKIMAEINNYNEGLQKMAGLDMVGANFAMQAQLQKLRSALDILIKDWHETDKKIFLGFALPIASDSKPESQTRFERLTALWPTSYKLAELMKALEAKNEYKTAWNKLKSEHQNGIVFEDFKTKIYNYNPAVVDKFLQAVDSNSVQAFLDQQFPKKPVVAKKTQQELLQEFTAIDQDFAQELPKYPETIKYLLSNTTYNDVFTTKPIADLFKDNEQMRNEDILKKFEQDLKTGLKQIQPFLQNIEKFGAKKAIGNARSNEEWPFNEN